MQENLPARPLIELFNEANTEAELAEGMYSQALEHALRAGRLLNEAKSRVKHGEWLPLLSTHWIGGESTARRYMQLAREQEKLPVPNRSSSSDLRSPPVSQVQALEIIKPKVPEVKREPPPANRVLDEVAGRVATYNWNSSDIEKMKELIKHRDQYSLKQWETVKDAIRRSIQSLTAILEEMEND